MAMKSFSLVLISALILFASCASRQRSAAYGWSGGNSQQLFKGKLEEQEDKRMMIYNATVNIDVKSVDSASAQVSAMAKQYNGFVVSSGNYSTTIRVPAASLKDVLARIGTIGKITSKNISGKDVTDEFTDYSIRLDNAEKARKRYQELLAKANTVDEILKVEKELERLNGEIDLLKGKMNRIQHLVEYSTITVYHSKKAKPGVLGYVFVGIYKGVKWLFVRD